MTKQEYIDGTQTYLMMMLFRGMLWIAQQPVNLLNWVLNNSPLLGEAIKIEWYTKEEMVKHLKEEGKL